MVKQPSISLAQDKESPPAWTDVLTTMLRHQLCLRRALHKFNRTSAKPARGATRHTSQQSSEADTAAAVADSDAADVVTASA